MADPAGAILATPVLRVGANIAMADPARLRREPHAVRKHAGEVVVAVPWIQVVALDDALLVLHLFLQSRDDTLDLVHALCHDILFISITRYPSLASRDGHFLPQLANLLPQANVAVLGGVQ